MTSSRTRLVLLAGASLLATSALSGPILDVWNGTVEMQDGVPVLRRCDVTQTRYVLKPLENPRILEQLPAAAVARGTKVSVTVIGAYEQSGPDAHILRVNALQNIRVGHSCQLLDALDDL